MRVPVLAYHSNNVAGNAYADNDHVALAVDLARIHRSGRRIVPLRRVVDALLGTAPPDACERAVALSFDDGSWFDWHDIDHPTCGPQRGFGTILREFARTTGAAVHATSFVIVSPDARAILDRTCLAGRGWWDDAWWARAESEGLMSIQSHSWDHHHPTLPDAGDRHGSFRTIDSHALADTQIRQASDWLDAFLPARRTRLFAYPYGETNAYLLDDYLPRCIDEHRLLAAFSTDPGPVHAASPRWNLPRYVCGQHWRSPDELERVLADA